MTRARVAAALLAAATFCSATAAHGHVVVQHLGLRQLLQGSEIALVAEIVSPPRTWQAPDGSDRQDFFRVRPLETLHGPAPKEPFDVFPHAEGMPDFRQGDVVLLFLERTAARPEFAGLATRFAWYTIQERGQEWKLEGAGGDRVRAAARAYRALREEKTAAGSTELRALLLRNLASGVGALREDAVAELVRARAIPGFFARKEDVAPFAALLAREAGLPLTTRVALTRLLDGHQGHEAGATLRAMTTEPLTPAERLQLVRVVGPVPDAGLTSWLGERLRSPEATERREAAYALGYPWHEGQLMALAFAMHDADTSVARAALRAVGAMNTAESARVMQRVASGDRAFLRQLAQAELRRSAAEAENRAAR